MATAIDDKPVTRSELKSLVRELLHEIIQEEQEIHDPEEGLPLKPELVDYLKTALKERRRGTPLEEVRRELGIDRD
jgi:hypothetical protein